MWRKHRCTVSGALVRVTPQSPSHTCPSHAWPSPTVPGAVYGTGNAHSWALIMAAPSATQVD